MNEKIKELFHQAYGYPIDIVGEQAEKFAELIVNECIEVVERQRAKMSYGPTFVIGDIKQHFGVEE